MLKEIRARLKFLTDVGIDYLTLDRAAGTLSGGESQRIRLATQIGSSLTGVLYVLDEPSIGLHQRDNRKLLDTLKRLRDLGNTVIVVEHDEDTIARRITSSTWARAPACTAATWLPQGPPRRSRQQEILDRANISPASNADPRADEQRREPTGIHLDMQGARENNLKTST